MPYPLIKNLIKKMFVFLLIVNFCDLVAEEKKTTEHSTNIDILGAYYFGNQSGFGQTGGFAPINYTVKDKDVRYYEEALDPGRTLGNGWGGIEAKVVVSHNIKVPFLTLDNPLFKDNNITFNFAGELTPISFITVTEVIMSPIAFLKFSAGGKLGTGWNLAGLNGLGRNLSGLTYESAQDESIKGLVYKLWFSGTFQFDLGAVVKGDWTHILILATAKMEYQAFTGADADTSWQFEADKGENFNSWKFWGTYFLGYQMPLLLDMVGVLLETEQYLGRVSEMSTMSTGGWGSDFIFLRFGPVFNLKFSEKSSLALLLQFKTERDYTDETIENRYFGLRKYEKTYFFLERLAFDYALRL